MALAEKRVAFGLVDDDLQAVAKADRSTAQARLLRRATDVAGSGEKLDDRGNPDDHDHGPQNYLR
jgi:hypothetical protein